MIDNISAPLPTPSVSPIANTQPSSAGNQGATATDAGTSAAESFASTLQSRMQQAVANKPVARDAAVNAKTPKAIDLDALLALHADKPANPANPVALAALAAHENGENPADAVLEAVAAKLAAKDKGKTDEATDKPIATPDANAQATALTALNVVANVPVAATTVTPPADKPNQQNEAAPAPAMVKADEDAAAILAAASDKNAASPANPDKSKDSEFADLLKNNTAAVNVGTHANHIANTTATTTREVRTPISSPQWSADVGNQVSWMVSQRESHADLVLNPPQLGRIEVSISLNGDQATANFVSPNADVRDALQGSLPRLREILADAGVFLGQANIGAESFQQNGNGAEKGTNSYGESISSSNETLLGSVGRSVSQSPLGAMRGQGLIDLFA